MALVNFYQVPSYFLDTLFLLPTVESHYIKQGYRRLLLSKELRGINETALRLFQTQLDLYDRGCPSETGMTNFVSLTFN